MYPTLELSIQTPLQQGIVQPQATLSITHSLVRPRPNAGACALTPTRRGLQDEAVGGGHSATMPHATP